MPVKAHTRRFLGSILATSHVAESVADDQTAGAFDFFELVVQHHDNSKGICDD